MDNFLFESFQYWHSQKLQDQTLAIFTNQEMTQFWTVNYICNYNYKLLFRTIFILIASYFQLLLNIFYCRSTAIVSGTVFFYNFWRFWKLFVYEENIFSLLIFMLFFYPKTINFHNSGIVSNVLSTGLQYTLSFK